MKNSSYLSERAKILLSLKELDEKFLETYSSNKSHNIGKVIELMEQLEVTSEDMISEFAKQNLLSYERFDNTIRKMFSSFKTFD